MSTSKNTAHSTKIKVHELSCIRLKITAPSPFFTVQYVSFKRLFLGGPKYISQIFTDFSKKRLVLQPHAWWQWGVGVNFLDVSDCLDDELPKKTDSVSLYIYIYVYIYVTRFRSFGLVFSGTSERIFLKFSHFIPLIMISFILNFGIDRVIRCWVISEKVKNFLYPAKRQNYPTDLFEIFTHYWTILEGVHLLFWLQSDN